MADNLETDVGSGGAILASDEDTANSRHFPGNKIMLGIENSFDKYWNGDITNAGTFATQATLQAGIAEIGKLAAGVAEIGNVKNSGTFATQATLQAGSASIGTLGANSGVDIGDVDVTSYPGPADAKFATLGQKNKAGSMPVTLASDEDALNTIVTNAGTFVVQEDGAALTALQLIDDTVATLGTTTYTETTTKGLVMGAVRNDVLAALADTDNEIAPLQVAAEGALWTMDAPNLVDSGNSTTSTLAGSATFTGASMEILQYAAITVQIFADQDGAALGMRFEFSVDGTNWDISHRHDYKASTGRTFQFTAHAKFFRVVFINGSTIQAAFRLQTILHRSITNTTIHRLDEELAPDRSATVVKASIMAQAAGSGDFVPVDATASGNLKISLEEISDGLDIGAGNAGSETQRVSISTDDVNLASINTDATTIAGAVSGSEMQVDVVAALPAGSNLIGDVGLSGARTSGGTTLYKNIDVDAKDEVKATAGQVYWIHAMNTTAAPVFLKFYDLAAASVTVGTTVPDLTFLVPANADSDGAGFALSIPNGIEFTTGITIAGTALVADNDNTALDANALIVNLGFG